jgi:RNA polymerase sigma factor (sigma-70 family)
MPEPTDIDLAREFGRGGSESAFAEIVRRHINLVYSIALRYVGKSHDAEEVTQVVFIILARKAASLRDGTVLGGWLYETTRFTAVKLMRTNARRHVREQAALAEATPDNPSDEASGIGSNRSWRLAHYLTKGGLPASHISQDGDLEKLIFNNETFSRVAQQLESFLDQPTLDKTGLFDRYDVEFQWPKADGEARRTVRRKVILDQLDRMGLELVPSHEQIEILVVDRATN